MNRKWLRRFLDDKVRRYRWEKRFWIAMIAPTVLWWHSSVLWVALLSIYALVITAGGAEQAAEAAKEAAKE